MTHTTVLSCSGGKDSTAAGLYLKEQGRTFEAIFCDTGWEHQETYRYLREVLPAHLGPIRWLRATVRWQETVRTTDGKSSEQAAELATRLETYAQEFEARLGVEYSPFVRLILKKAGFPTRLQRSCTPELKATPAWSYLATLDDPLNVVGVRAEESEARAQMPEREYDPRMDCDVWRPIIRWKLDDVIAIHKRHNLSPNPLYLRNATRVGCYPCIMSRKAEIRTLDAARVSIIADLERVVADLHTERIRRRGEEPVMRPPTFFQASTPGEDGGWVSPIDEVMAWARTAHGGRQYELFAAAPRDAGCMRWGLCDTGGGS